MKRRDGMGSMAGRILVGGMMALVVMAQVALARPAHGARVEVTLKADSEKVMGELQLVRPGEIIIQTRGGADRTIPLKDITIVRIVRKSAVLQGLALGAAVGGGACYGLSSASNKGVFLGGIAVAAWSAGGVAVGALVGGLIGGARGKDRVYNLSNLQPGRYAWMTAELRKYARVRSST